VNRGKQSGKTTERFHIMKTLDLAILGGLFIMIALVLGGIRDAISKQTEAIDRQTSVIIQMNKAEK